jgi:hypothetical protein
LKEFIVGEGEFVTGLTARYHKEHLFESIKTCKNCNFMEHIAAWLLDIHHTHQVIAWKVDTEIWSDLNFSIEI